MKTEPSKLEQALRDSPDDVFEARASNGVEVDVTLKSEVVTVLCLTNGKLCSAIAFPDTGWVVKENRLNLALAGSRELLELSRSLHAIAEVLEMLNGEREWGEE